MEIVVNKDATYKKLKISYILTTDDREICVSVFAYNFSDEDISSCSWGCDSFTEQSMKPIVAERWSHVEEVLSYGVNDNYDGTLPYCVTRFFKYEDFGLDLCDEIESTITARIIIDKYER